MGPLWADVAVLELEATVAQHGQCADCHWWRVCLNMVKMVDFTLYTFYYSRERF